MTFKNACAVSALLAGMCASSWAETARAQACPEVDQPRELMITDLNVVENAQRTTGDGVWTFKHLMEAMAPNAAAAPGMVEAMFSTWLTDQSINGQVIPARPSVQDVVLNGWPRGADGELDLAQAPMRLLAVVNRLDLRSLSKGQAGEGRFVFGVTNPAGDAEQFTLIFEYRLPASSETDVLDWANLWHGLSAFTVGSDDYNAALETITERFAGRGADPNGANGSALNQIRTNEIALAGPWELREFTLSGSALRPDTVKLTPNTSFMSEAATVAAFVNQNESDILVERHDVPEVFNGESFLGGSSINPNNRPPWIAAGINNNEARHKFSLNTCNGCHGSETATVFLHIEPRAASAEARLSGFLTGVSVNDPVDGSSRRFADLDRRATDMSNLLCIDTSGLQERSTNEFIAEGIGRVH